MNSKKIAQLRKYGWKTGDAGDFLGLSPRERSYVEMKVALARMLLEYREKKHLTQKQVADLLQSSQSRVAKMEKNDGSVSIDLLVRSLFALGVTRHKVGDVIRN